MKRKRIGRYANYRRFGIMILEHNEMEYFDESGDWGRNNVIEKPTKKDFYQTQPGPLPCALHDPEKRIWPLTDIQKTAECYDFGC